MGKVPLSDNLVFHNEKLVLYEKKHHESQKLNVIRKSIEH